ncbi:MAG: hypothetical protein ABIK67_00240 [candidate division WOR-3 bacterium]
MVKIVKILFSGLTFILLLSLDCQKGSNRVIIPNLGFSMNLPADWQTDPKDPTSFYEPAKRDDNWGMVVKYQLEEEQTVEEFVENTLKESEKMESMFEKMTKTLGNIVGEEELEKEVTKTRIVAKTQRKIGNFNAIEVIKEAEYKVIELYIGKDGEVIEVFFRALPEDFAKYETAFQKAFASIKLQETE